MLSVVIPSYNEEGNIQNTAGVIGGILDENSIEYELIFVDDGSKDSTWAIIAETHSADSRVKGVSLSRNFGKEGAILAGLEASKGDAVVVIDCDLQHPPKVIPEMYKLWQNGTMVVEGRKSARGSEKRVYGGLSLMFNSLFGSTSHVDMKDASDFKLLDRRVVREILAFPERKYFFRAISSWAGFKTEHVYFDVEERKTGSRKWTPIGLMGYALRNIASFTNMPLLIPAFAGGAVVLAALVLLILLTCGADLGSFNAAVAVLMLIGGMILASIGVLGYYLARVFEETKGRPRFIVEKTTE